MDKGNPRTTESTPVAGPSSPRRGLSALLVPYRGSIAALVGLTIAGNALNLLIPKLVADAIDSYGRRTLVLGTVAPGLLLAAAGILIFGYLQGIVQTYAADRVARDLRTRLITRIAAQDPAYIQQVTPAALLTHLTSDVDAVKMFVAMVIASLISSVFLIVGASVLLIAIDWRLALGVLAILPVVGVTFSVVLGRVRTLFKRGQEAIDWLNKVINESILGAALIRLVNSQQVEFDKFVAANAEARDISLSILRLFSSLIPVIVFATNLATLVILVLGGRFVINGTMTLGEFTAFNSYLVILIFPVVMIGFMSTMMAQASASYARIAVILDAPERPRRGTLTAALGGNIALRHVDVELGGRRVLKDVSFDARAGSRTAVIGPTAAGKTQLLYLLTGLIEATAGSVEYDGAADRRLRSGVAPRPDRVRLPGQRHLQPEPAREHRLQPRRHRRRSRKSDRDGRARRLHPRASVRARHGRVGAWQQPVGRPEATGHAGAGAGAQPSRAAARRLHGARRYHDGAQDPRERSQELPGHHAPVGHAADRAGRRLRPDHPADGRRDPRLRHARDARSDLTRIRADL